MLDKRAQKTTFFRRTDGLWHSYDNFKKHIFAHISIEKQEKNLLYYIYRIRGRGIALPQKEESMKLFYKMMAALLSIMMMAALTPLSALASMDAVASTKIDDISSYGDEETKDSPIWSGTVATGFAGGTGTETEPYLIATGEQLAYLAQTVNNGNTYAGMGR